MNENYFNKMNSSIAIYFGFSFIIGSLGCLIGTIVTVFKYICDKDGLSISTLFTLILITLFTGGIGYSLYRIGTENLKK